MDPNLKKVLKALSLELRHLLEGWYDAGGAWHAGDLEQRLAGLGVWRGREPLPADEFGHLPAADRAAREVVDAYLALRREAGVARADAVAEFVRETAYTWANRLLALRCMEARGLIDEVILQRDAYAGRSLEHHRLIRRLPELAAGGDDGLYAALDAAFARQAGRKLPLFDPHAPAVALKPSVAALRRCVALLSGTEPLRGAGAATDEVFQAHDALGWAYQYWNTEEKDRVFEKVRTQKGAKIAGADIIPATQLYTEPYMVKFLVQNSLGALWMAMHPGSRLYEKWEYYVRDADRAPVTPKPVREISFLDPATGSGHFHLEAFDLLYDMYVEEGELTDPTAICAAILEYNLYGIDIDERAIQIAEAALWMKAAERTFDFPGAAMNLVATNIRLPKGKDHLQAFLAQHPEDRELRPALEAIFEGLEHADELGSLLQIEEPVERELRYLRAKAEAPVDEPEQPFLLPEMEEPKQGRLPLGLESYDEWKTRTLARLRAHFAVEAETADPRQAFFGHSASKGVSLFELLGRRYDIVVANPPYMGSRNMGGTLKTYLNRFYVAGKLDLYTAFILRNLILTRESGSVGMVTLESWMFLSRFTSMREALLDHCRFTTVAHLGRHAFGEVDPPGNPVMFVMQAQIPTRDQGILCLRLVEPNSPDSQAAIIRDLLIRRRTNGLYRPLQRTLRCLPGARMAYFLGEDLSQLLLSDHRLGDNAEILQGLATANNDRFMRYTWERPPRNGWYLFAKGGGFQRWAGNELWTVDWRDSGARIKALIDPLTQLPYSNVWMLRRAEKEFFFQTGLTYTKMAQRTMDARVLSANSIFSHKGTGIFLPADAQRGCVLAFLNSRLASFLLRALTPKDEFGEGHVRSLPVLHLPDGLETIGEKCIELKRELLGQDPCEMEFMPSSYTFSAPLRERFCLSLLNSFSVSAALSTAVGTIDRLVGSAANLTAASWQLILNETSTPAAWYPLVKGYNDQDDDLVSAVAIDHPADIIDSCEVPRLLSKLEDLFRAGPDEKNKRYVSGRSSTPLDDDDEVEDEEDESEELIGSRVPIPSETFLEELSVKLQLHPVSVASLLRKGMMELGWRCRGLEVAFVENLVTVVVAQLLGHRWPKQIEAGEPIPDWADPDGIIPLTEGAGEPTLYDRVRERIAAEFPGGSVTAIEAEFAEIMGQPLAQWLTHDFFKHHTSQFKKRPIAWQIGSARFTARRRPAFACLVYYHKLAGDTLASIQSQYVRPLRGRYETELRGIEAIPAAARSERQAGRRIELEGWIAELREFDDKLGQVAAEGFASGALAHLVDQEPADSWCSLDGIKPRPVDREALLRQEMAYIPDLNDGVRVNIAPLQKAGLLAADVIASKDVEKAIADRAEWRADERRWCREGKLARPGWWRMTRGHGDGEMG